MHSLDFSINKCKEIQNKVPRHQGMIKLVYEGALNKQPPRNIHVKIKDGDEHTPLAMLLKRK